MRKLRRISKKYYLRQIVSCWLIYYMVFFFGMPASVATAVENPLADALPTNPSVIAGSVGNIDDTIANELHIQDIANKTIINWQNHDIGSDALVEYQFTNPGGRAMSRVMDGDVTGIMGKLNSNGGVFLINPAGIVFGKSAVINVSQLVASSLNITDYDFRHGSTYTFTGGSGEEVGDVTNYATDITAEKLALIGRNVYNYGALSAEKYVVMAAGDTVLLNDGSPVSVKVTMGDDWNMDDYCVYQVENEGDGIESERVVLAAGDVWSMACIDAHDEAASDAVASVDIYAAGDVTIEDDVTAEAVGNGVDDAIATITVAAGDDVEISSDGSHSTEVIAKAEDGKHNTAEVTVEAVGDVDVLAQNGDAKIMAEADSDEFDGVSNKANVEIKGKNVTIKSENCGWGDDDATVKAWAKDAEENIANVTLTATGEEVTEGEGEEAVIVMEGGDVRIESQNYKGDDATVMAKAEQGTKNTATVDIEAADDVKIQSSEEDAVVKAEASNKIYEADVISGLTNTAAINIDAAGRVEIEAKGEKSADVAVEAIAKNEICLNPEIGQEDSEESLVSDLAIENLTNTATVDITGSSVEVKGAGKYRDTGAEAVVKAVAGNELKVDIDNWDEVDTTVNLDVTNLENNAGVTIAANGEGCRVGFEVEGDEGYGLVKAEAYNELEVKHKSYGDYQVAPITLNMTVSKLDNTAEVDVSSANGDVTVRADESKRCEPYTAGVEAEAYNEFDLDKLYSLDEISPGSLIFNRITNVASIGVTAGDDVEVLAEDGGEARIMASAYNELETCDSDLDLTGDNIINNAGVTVDAGDDVKVEAECRGNSSDAYIVAEAYNEGDIQLVDGAAVGDITNTANVDITAGGDVKVIGKDGGDAEIVADTWVGTENTSSVTINTLGGDVLVLGDNGDASIEALAEEGVDNTATVAIDAVGGDVLVIDKGGDDFVDTAKIVASAEEAYNSNTADVTINATATQEVYETEIDNGEEIKVVKEACVNGGNVLVIGKDGGHAAITAYAAEAGGEQTNTANVTINTTAEEGFYYELVEKPVYSEVEPYDLLEPAVYEKVTYTDGGDVKVIGKDGGKAEIEAIAKDNYSDEGENIANVLICIDGDLKVKGENYGKAEIEAIAKDAYSNTASVGIGAKGECGVEVVGEYGGEASIGTKAKDGYTNTAETIVCTQGDIAVIGNGGEAYIGSEALDGFFNNAYTGVCAVSDIYVVAGVNPFDMLLDGPKELTQFDIQGMGGYADIYSEAAAGYYERAVDVESPDYIEEQMPTADARTVAVSKEGSVVVADVTSEIAYGSSGITAEAYNAFTNTASVGVAGGATLSPANTEPVDDIYYDPGTGNVIVYAYGPGSDARIMSEAYDGYENTAQTVVCAPGEVALYADSYEGGMPLAKIKSLAEGGTINHASTQVYASEVDIDVPGLYRGNGIWAYAEGVENNPRAPADFIMTEYDDEFGTGEFVWTAEQEEGDSTAELLIRDYSKRKDCPECPDCPCGEVSAPVAPLPVIETPRVEGCPGLMLAASLELGIASETVQVGIGNALALNPSLQPCEACASIVNAAKILRDPDGTRMAALVQTFNTLAPANTPMSPEMEASIATAFADAPEGSQYALAKEYIDAFVQYASVLDNQLGSPVGDSTNFVMTKYGTGITQSNNNNVAAYLTARIQSQ
jgi:filamentous hemagglutinin family protein